MLITAVEQQLLLLPLLPKPVFVLKSLMALYKLDYYYYYCYYYY